MLCKPALPATTGLPHNYGPDRPLRRHAVLSVQLVLLQHVRARTVDVRLVRLYLLQLLPALLRVDVGDLFRVREARFLLYELHER